MANSLVRPSSIHGMALDKITGILLGCNPGPNRLACNCLVRLYDNLFCSGILIRIETMKNEIPPESLEGRCQAVHDAWEDLKAVFLETLRCDLQAIVKWIRYRTGKGDKK